MVDLEDAGRRLAVGVSVETPPIEAVRNRADRIARRRRLAAVSAAAILALGGIAAGIVSTRGGSSSSLQVVNRPSPAVSGPAPTGVSSYVPSGVTPALPFPPSPVSVPRVIGMPYDQANLAVDQVNLGIAISLVDSDTVDPGIVISQNPAPGSTATTFFTTVSVAVSDGPTQPLTGPSCRSQDLRLDFGGRVSEMTGQNTTDLVLTNISGSICNLFGYPTVTLLDQAGKVLPFEYSHTGDMMTTSAQPRVVSLRPGWSAYVRINKYRCDVHADDTAAALRLAVPGSSSPPLSSSFSGFSLDYCAEAASTTVTISPFESTELALFDQH